MYATRTQTPIGWLRLYASEDALVGVYFDDHGAPTPADLDAAQDAPDHPVLARARAQLAAYFDGALTRFDLPLAPVGTPFQRQVWDLLMDIPFGHTRAYADLAERLGRPSASRAVGAANRRNPISIIVPCHRVIAKSGALAGYAGGIAHKRWLLAHEARHSRVSSPDRGQLPLLV